MSIEHVLAVVPVSDLPASREWYCALFGSQPDNDPMPTLTEWRVTSQGWVQVFVDAALAGSGLLNLAVGDLDAQIADLRGRGIEPEPVVDASNRVRIATVKDPDGNTISFIGGFRVHY